MKLKALSIKEKLEFSIPNLPNYRAFYDTFTELKNATEVSTELTPSYKLQGVARVGRSFGRAGRLRPNEPLRPICGARISEEERATGHTALRVKIVGKRLILLQLWALIAQNH